MITYNLNDCKISKYEALYRFIKEDIISGTLKADEKLPSKRAFAKNLGISVITVENAYEQLISEGFIYSKPRSGFFVMDISRYLMGTGAFNHNSGLSNSKTTYDKSDFTGTGALNQVSDYKTVPASTNKKYISNFSISSETSNLQSSPASPEITDLQAPISISASHPQNVLVDFSTNQTDPATFPFSTWAKITREVISEKQSALMTNPPVGGVWELRNEISNYLKQFKNMNVSPEQIIVGAGTEYIFGLLIQLLGINKTYAVEKPGYDKIVKICNAHNVKTLEIPIDNQGLDISIIRHPEGLITPKPNVIDKTLSEYINAPELQIISSKSSELSNIKYSVKDSAKDSAKNSTKNYIKTSGIISSTLSYIQEPQILHVTPSHHFPTGITMPITRRYELLMWASEQTGRYIIEDDYDSEFRMTGIPIPTLYSIDNNERVIYLNTFTKSLCSTIRIAYMVLPLHLVREFNNNLSFYSCTISTFEQYTLAKFMETGHFEKHINRMRNFYRKKRNYVLNVIENSKLSQKAEIMEENSGLHFLIKLDLGKQNDENYMQKLKNKGVLIKKLPESEHTFIINYSFVNNKKLEQAIDVMYQCIDN